MRFGKYCNVSDSYLFMNVMCNICCIKDERDGVVLVRNFDDVFSCGVEVLKKLKSGDGIVLK